MQLERAQVPALLFGLAFLITAVAYGLSLSGPFLFDDLQNIVGNPFVQPATLDAAALKAAASAYPGFPGRPVATLSFALNYRFSGLDPAAFRAVNLGIHLLCGIVLLKLLRTLLALARTTGTPMAPDEGRADWITTLAASAWLLHPLQVSTVLYAVQRMTLLATLFSLLGMLAYLRMRRAQLAGGSGALAALGLLASAAAAVLSKESGALLPLYCSLLELAVLRLHAARPAVRRLLRIVWLGGGALAILALLLSLPALLAWLQHGYGGREFTLGERLLTQPRVLVLYLRLLLLPDPWAMTLHHDDLPLSTGWQVPWTTLPAVLAILAALGATVAGLLGRHRLLALGPALFLAGHLLESTVVPLELVFEHRNHFPAMGLMLTLALLAIRAPRPLLALPVVVLLAGLTVLRAQLFADPLALVQHGLRHHPASPRSQLWGGDTHRALAAGAAPQRQAAYLEAAVQNYRRASRLDAGDSIGLLSALAVQAQLGQSLDASSYAELARRLREGPVRVGTIYGLQGFLEAIAQGQSPFPAAEALALADHLLANPRCTGRGRAMVLSAAATVRTENLGDYEGAIAQSREATHLQPDDASLWIPLAVILRKAGREAEALAAARQALAVDRGAYGPSLEAFLATIPEPRPAP